MKYYNKQKYIRLSEWATASPPSIYRALEAVRWCQQNPSKSKFYFHHTNTCWWFEDSQDALAFSLAWSGK